MEEPILEVSEDYDAEFNISESLVINAVSPQVSVQELGGTPAKHRIRITDINGSRSVDISDGKAAGFGTVSASVDANVGTPSVNVTAGGTNEAKNFNFAFHNLKGTKGDTGDPGGFGTITAKMDPNNLGPGTPAVNVAASGTNAAKNLAFTFSNLKGAKGATGDKGDKGDKGDPGQQGPAGQIDTIVADEIFETTRGEGVEVTGPLALVEANGWAEQESTTGKNLLPSLSPNTTLSGFTVTVNPDKSVTLNGTNSSDGTVSITFPCPESLKTVNTYTISTTTVLPQGVEVVIKTVNSTWERFDAGYSSMTRTVGISALYLDIDSGTTLTNFTIYPQIESGSTATSYEPYTEGFPSPSPDYPQEIKVARGRNLLDAVLLKSTSTERLMNTSGIRVEAGRSYTFSGKCTVIGSSNDARIFASIHPTAMSVTQGTSISGATGISAFTFNAAVGTNTKTFTAPSSGWLYITIGGIVGTQFEWAQLTLGSTPQPYVPYGHVGLDVQGKNLLSCKSSDWMYHGISGASRRTVFIPVENNTSYIYHTTTKIGLISFWYNAKTGASESISTHSNHSVYTFTNTDGWTHLTLARSGNLSAEEVAASILSSKAMVEKGSTATEYEPYFHETCAIPLPERGWVGGLPDGTSDALSIDSAGKVKWEMETNEVILDGSEGWSLQGSGVRVSATLRGIKRPSSASTVWRALSSHFAAKSGNATWSETTPGFSASESSDTIHFADGTKAMTVAAWTTWLSSNPVTVLYPLAEPVTEQLGYITLPDIPSDATVSIPELENLGVKWWLDSGAVVDYHKDLQERLEATNLAEIEDAVVDLTEFTTDINSRVNVLQKVSLDGTVTGPLASVTAKGHAEQFSTTGKNLTNLKEWTNTTTDTRALNARVLGYKNGAFSGELSSIAVVVGTNFMTFTANDSDTYYLKHGGQQRDLVMTYNLFTTGTPVEGQQYTVSFVAESIDSTTVGGAVLKNFQLELGSVATEYEPYTGGAPSPSPDYPQEIQVVRGRNLVRLDSGVSNTINGITFTPLSDNSISISGTATANASYFFCNQFNWSSGILGILPQRGRTYTLSTSLQTSNVLLYFWSKLGGSVSSKKSITFTIPDEDPWNIFLYVINGTSVNETVTNIQLTEGSTPQPYVPYGHVGIDVYGRNILDGYSLTLGKVINAEGNYINSSANNRATEVYVPCADIAGKRVVLSSRPTGNTASIAFYDNKKELILTIQNNSAPNDTPWEFDVPNKAAYIRVSAWSESTTLVMRFATPIPLPQRGWVGGLPDGTSDILSIDSAGKVKWELTIDLIGATDFELFTASQNRVSFGYTNSDIRKYLDSAVIPDVMSNMHIAHKWDETWYGGYTGINNNQTPSVIVTFAPDDVTTASAMQAKYPNLTVLYPLATPIIEDCGYVDLPDIPSEATVSIPELEELGLTFWVDGDGTIRAAMQEWYERAVSEFTNLLNESNG